MVLVRNMLAWTAELVKQKRADNPAGGDLGEKAERVNTGIFRGRGAAVKRGFPDLSGENQPNILVFLQLFADS